MFSVDCFGINEDVVMFSKVRHSGSFYMLETIFNVLVEECQIAFLQIVKIICCGFEYNAYVLCVFFYQVRSFSMDQLVELTTIVSDSESVCQNWSKKGLWLVDMWIQVMQFGGLVHVVCVVFQFSCQVTT